MTLLLLFGVSFSLWSHFKILRGGRKRLQAVRTLLLLHLEETGNAKIHQTEKLFPTLQNAVVRMTKAALDEGVIVTMIETEAEMTEIVFVRETEVTVEFGETVTKETIEGIEEIVEVVMRMEKTLR